MNQAIGPGPFDAAVFEAVRQLIPLDRLKVHLEELDRQMLALADAALTGPGLQDKAHRKFPRRGCLA